MDKNDIKAYGKHNEGCKCDLCKRVEKWYDDNRTCCMPELERQSRFA